jgi:hypothetical protein
LKFRKGLKPIGVEVSEKSSKIAKSRGLDVINSSWQQVKLKNFDHIFALMNGMGLAQSLAELDKLLRKCKSMLKVGGVLWIDSTDVTYAKAFWPQTNTNYFGLVEFKLKYKGRTQKFPWLFVDRFTAMEKARKAGFSIENCRLERNGHYLLQLRKIS